MKGLYLLMVFLAVIVSAYSLKCYQCHSSKDPECEDIKDETYLKECGDDGNLKDSPQYTVCRKLDQWVDFELLGQKPFKRVIRQCGIIPETRTCFYKAGFGGRANSCDCEGDGCNGASTMAVLPAFLIFSVVIAAFYTRS